MINRKNIIVIAIMAIMLMGSVVLSAAQFNIHNVHSNQTLHIYYPNYQGTGHIGLPIGQQTTTTTVTVDVPITFGGSVITVTQGDRTVTRSVNYNGHNDSFDITLPGPWEKLPGQEDPQ